MTTVYETNPDQQVNQSLKTTYQQMLAAITEQLHLRRGLLAKRALIATLPGISFIVFVTILFSLETLQPLTEKNSIGLLIPFWLFFSIFWYGITNVIFNLEQVIWVDSFYDRINLTAKQSLFLARKLLVTRLKLALLIFLRYYIWPVLAFLVIPIALITTDWFTLGTNSEAAVGLFATLFLLLSISCILISVKLRFLIFLFVDNYQPSDFSVKQLLKELHDITEATKKETFKKTLLAEFGATTVNGVASATLGRAERSKNAAVQAAAYYSQELASQGAAYSKLVAKYILYRYARTIAYNKPQQHNKYLYGLLSNDSKH